MYWYAKLPLYVILLALALWIGHAIYSRFAPEGGLSTLFDGQTEQAMDDSATSSAPIADTGGKPSATTDSNRRHETRMGEGGWAHLQSPSDLPPATPEQVPVFLAQAQAQLQGENLLAARNLCYRILAAPSVKPFTQTWWDTVDVLGEANMVFFTTDAPCPEKVRYEVQSGDNLIAIANAYETTVEAIQAANDMDAASSRIYPGMVLSIYVGDWDIDVSKKNFALILYDAGRIFKVYRVGIGKQDRTPVGEFVIKNKIREPAWTPPGRNIPFGDPENVLGTRWLGLVPVEDTDPTLQSYGIHGTWEPDSIGTASSQGCIRLRNDEVDELFDIIPYPPPLARVLENPDSGTRVTITNE